MKFSLTGALFLISSMYCFSQADTTKVSLIAYWSKGDSYDFKITKIQQQSRGDSLLKNDSTSYVTNFEVLDSTESSYRIKWKFKTDLTGNFNIPPKLLDRFSKYEMTEVIYKTDELGSFEAIENWEEISKIMTGMFSDLIEVMGEEAKVDTAVFRKKMQPFIHAYQSKEAIEQIVFKELIYLHFPFGVEYSLNKPLFYEELLPNLFGGPPLRSEVKLSLDYIDPENFYCIITQDMKVNPDDTRGMMQGILTGMFDSTTAASSVQSATFDLSDYNRYEYFYDFGLPWKIEYKRQLLIGMEKEQIKRIEILRIESLD